MGRETEPNTKVRLSALEQRTIIQIMKGGITDRVGRSLVESLNGRNTFPKDLDEPIAHLEDSGLIEPHDPNDLLAFMAERKITNRGLKVVQQIAKQGRIKRSVTIKFPAPKNS